MDNNKPIEYRCRIALEPQEFNDALVKFLKAKDSKAFTERDKVYSAVAGYWMPFAMRDAGFSEGESQQCAKESVYRLILHIRYLAQSFGLDLSEDASGLQFTTPKSNSSIMPKTAKDDIDDFDLSTQQEVSNSQPLNLIHHDDDGTFQELFS